MCIDNENLVAQSKAIGGFMLNALCLNTTSALSAIAGVCTRQ